MSVQIQLRRGLAADWTAANPTLAEGELGLELDTLAIKAGDGATAWADLVYLPTGGGGGGGQGASVQSVSVAAANGFSADVANPTTTPNIAIKTTVTGIMRGTGTAVVAATAGSDYLAPAGSGAALTGITFAQLTSHPTTLAGYGITDGQPLDAELSALAGLVSAADRLPYFTGSGTATLATFTAAGRALLDDADATAQRATLGLATVAATGAYTDLSGRPTLGTAAALNVPASGDAAVGEVVKGSDSRLTDARTPTAHNQAWSTITSTPTTLAGYGIGDAQPLDNELTALASVTAAANKVPYFTGSGTAAVADLTAAGRALIDDADATAQRATLGLVIGTDVQAYDAELAAIAGLTSAADKLPYFTGSGAAALATLTSAGRALVDDADAAAQRSTLGLATVASSFYWGTPANGTVPLSAKAAFACTLNQIRGLKTSGGTCTVTIQINGTTVTGLGSLSVTTTTQDVSATALNTVAAGDRVTVVIASVSSAAGLEFTLSATR
jgi:hypothetical protein